MIGNSQFPTNILVYIIKLRLAANPLNTYTYSIYIIWCTQHMAWIMF